MSRSIVVGVALLAAACFSAGPPAPPVRWFDPVVGVAGGAVVPVAFVTAPHLGREFVLRVAAHEVVVDAQHRWIAEPHQLLALAAGHTVPSDAASAALAVVTRFELDLTAAPCARIRLELRRGDGTSPIEVTAAAAGREPAALAAAMGEAIRAAVAACAAPAVR
jgi:hypothetical protein